MMEGRKQENLEKTSNDELQKKIRILKPEIPSPNRDSNPHSSIGGMQTRKTDVLTITPRVAP